MGNFIPLSSYEEEFRRYFNIVGDQTKDRALTLEEYVTLVEQAPPEYHTLIQGPAGNYSQSLSEEGFFTEREDISAVQHLRYMPAIYHVSEFFELECVLSGTITCFINEQRFELSEGDVLVLAPNTDHAACVYQEDGIMINVLVRRSTFKENFMGLLPNNDILRGFFEKALYQTNATPYLLFRTGDSAMLETHLLPLMQEYRRTSRYRNTVLSAMLSLFFVALMRGHEKDVIIPTIHAPVMNETTIFILEYLQRNIDSITLKHLAEFFNYSERQMQRIIYAATGMSFGENVKKIRMQRAAELLKSTELTVSEIADHLGYYDTSSFRHAFKSYYGTTPKSFR